MKHILENDIARIEISDHAAEIHSFKRKDKSFEYMWQGDPAYWSGRNPILFPQVLSAEDKVNIYKGREYPMGNHGFARNSEFTCIEEGKNHLVLILEDNEETLKSFPYRFSLKVTYVLEGSKVRIDYEIVNKDEEVMPVGFGLHPAFACPIDLKKKMEDYRFLFDEEEDTFFFSGRELTVSHELLDPDDKLIYGQKSKTVTMSDGENGVHVDCSQFRIVMFWSKPGASFACIEPWMFTQDPKDTGIPFIEKKDVLLIEAGDRYRIGTSYEIF